ncbi:MAG: methionine aminopeptidase [Pirellulaceae bacterium]|nr:MAG: methionine aminopeptidase [Pirellulaceae bacterium]
MLQNSSTTLQLTATERDAMRQAGRFNAELMDFVRQHVREGISTGQIDRLVYEYTMAAGHRPASLNYMGYPKSCCISVNDVVCHGIPGDYVLREGDLVNVDVATIVDGWHADQSETFLIGEVSQEARAVTQCAFDCLYLAIRALYPGCSVYDVGYAIYTEAARRGFSVVYDLVGHGLGRQFHQDPSVFHHPKPECRRVKLLPGMCFTIEPMINAGSRFTVLDKSDGWTIRTRDGKLSAQFEHSILMTENGPEILTQTALGPRPGHRF